MFDSILEESITMKAALICTAVSLVLGLAVAFAYKFKSSYTKSFLITLTLLPVIVQVVIMMVNGNVGTGVAVLGAFSLIRFRSVPGNSKDICIIFLAMAIGLATGMGYLAFAALFTVITCAVFTVLKVSRFGDEKGTTEKTLKVTIPEDMDYTKGFDEVFSKYTTKSSLEKVKTSNMGSLYELTYTVNLKAASMEKQFIDDLRCINSNLPIVCSRLKLNNEEL